MVYHKCRFMIATQKELQQGNNDIPQPLLPQKQV